MNETAVCSVTDVCLPRVNTHSRRPREDGAALSLAASLLSPALLACRLTRCVLGALGQAEEERFVHAVMLAEFDIDKGSICRTQYPKEVCVRRYVLSALSSLLSSLLSLNTL